MPNFMPNFTSSAILSRPAPRSRACGLLALTALCGLAWPSPGAAEQGRFDGSWGIEVVTGQGACDRLYRFYVTIDNGAVHARSMMGEVAADPVGRVLPNGRISGSFGAADDPVVVRGRLGPSAGSGRWSAPARGCSGQWNAFKRA